MLKFCTEHCLILNKDEDRDFQLFLTEHSIEQNVLMTTISGHLKLIEHEFQIFINNTSDRTLSCLKQLDRFC